MVLSQTLILSLNFLLNLLYVSQICHLDFDVHFSSTGCTIQDPHTYFVIETVYKVEHLFVFNHLYIPCTIIVASMHSTLWSLWHSHILVSYLKPLVDSSHLGFVSSISFDYMFCQIGKQTTFPFPISNSIILLI